MSSSESILRHTITLAAKGFALIGIYAVYGLLQERIIKGIYHYEGSTTVEAKFNSASLLVLCNRVVSLLTGLILVQFRPRIHAYSPLPPLNTEEFDTPPACVAERLARFRPASTLWHYALVAALNNGATLSQYASLSYLSFTTATLGKSAKMVPVLILGYVGYGKQYRVREWIGVAAVMLGVWGYLASVPEIEDDDRTTSILGVICLLGYLFFDGLTSTTQEKLFSKTKQDYQVSLLGISAGVMDQMIWVNLFSSLIAGTTVCFSLASAVPSLQLLLASPLLQVHVILLSATATFGLILLFHVIASYGALVAGLIMTLRQFVSVVCNAIAFGNMANISTPGWIAIGFVASGIWIKMDRRYDSPKNAMDGTAEEKVNLLHSRGSFSKVRQYMLPLVVCPLLFLCIKLASVVIDDATRVEFVQMIIPDHHSPLAIPATIQTGMLSESGNQWDERIVQALGNKKCPSGPLNSVRYDTNITTAIATYPRSGSSYTRTLIERATGYQTSCIYCDPPFDQFFSAECDSYDNPFLVKTHFPSELKHGGDREIHWMHYDRYLEVVRNPIDIMWSVRNLMRTHDHTQRVDYKFTMEDVEELKPHLADWNLFLDYWRDAPIEGLVVRYEDIRDAPFANIGKIVSYLLPMEDLPTLDRIACAIQLDEEKEMYPSKKIQPFQDWELHFEKDVLEWIITGTQKNWCAMGYNKLFARHNGGWEGPVDCSTLHHVMRTSVANMQGP